MDTPNNSPEHESPSSKHDYLWDKSGEPDPEIPEAGSGTRQNFGTPAWFPYCQR